MRDLLLYSLLRVVILLALWWVLMQLGFGMLLGGVLAVLIAMMLSFLLLDRPRRRAALRLQEADEARRARRGPVRDEDADEEDSLLDEPRG
ncbi:DUF4229 domain-containing protein [Brachybacterium sp. JHP9]|uniref:DUF4229 domain-containing protein n=1 Tax=Brachybacterium equifaecis TaxID=2910770 RepID=A0ABT0QYW1_9MICO|nr:DUF4229 domain-containing protein [Brachybacterium equifaecis]MCL6422850.1 DUF4229 domain-containing protein [Brachybacterium equifaecis]